ncbi:hypothetical protein, partial [Plantactinospora endophytica]|uniref:hypothetical protein n=1 Tax=Plantactinospora endophytica TaxID=673535 RepID=UPI00364323FC
MPNWLKKSIHLEKKLTSIDWCALKLDKPKFENLISDSFLEKHSNDITFIRINPLRCSDKGDEILNSLLEKYL